MAITEIYSGATYFGIPVRPYFGAYLLMMIMYLGPTLVALGWALTVGQGRRPALRLVRPLGRWRDVHRPVEQREEGARRGDRAA